MGLMLPSNIHREFRPYLRTQHQDTSAINYDMVRGLMVFQIYLAPFLSGEDVLKHRPCISRETNMNLGHAPQSHSSPKSAM
jgi:hypothetical protein